MNVSDSMMNSISKVISMNVHVTFLEQSSDQILLLANDKSSSYVCVSNVHMCMEVYDDHNFASVVNSADLVVPDGRPIFWAQRLLGFNEAQQVRGQDLMNYLCANAARNQLNIGLYGGSSEAVLSKVRAELLKLHPELQIPYAYSPPFKNLSSLEMADIADAINTAGVNILFVGIGCPKQELWMAAQKGSVNCVMLGVGAAFDFISGSKSHAPRWMQYAGLEWLFRLISEPSRLWKRYLIQNPRFIFYFIKQLLSGKK